MWFRPLFSRAVNRLLLRSGLSGHARESGVPALPPAVQRALRLHGGHNQRQRGESLWCAEEAVARR